MGKRFPVRIRTFLVPLFGAALYFLVQLIVTFIFVLSVGSDDIYGYTGSIMIIVAIVMLPCLIVWLVLSKRLEKKEILRQKLSTTTGISGVIIAIGMLGIVNIYFAIIVNLSSYIPGIRESLFEYSEMVSDAAITLLSEKILYGFAVALLIPVVEELLFRGIIMQEFISTMGKIPAIILSGLVFGLMHGQPIQIGYAFICGMIISTVYYYSRSIYLAILTHVIFNFFGTTATGLIGNNEQAAIILEYIEYAFIFLAVAAMMYLGFTWKKTQIREETSCGTS